MEVLINGGLSELRTTRVSKVTSELRSTRLQTRATNGAAHSDGKTEGEFPRRSFGEVLIW
jgi:hypothetical protein